MSTILQIIQLQNLQNMRNNNKVENGDSDCAASTDAEKGKTEMGDEDENLSTGSCIWMLLVL